MAVTITAGSLIDGKGEILAPATLEVENGTFTAALDITALKQVVFEMKRGKVYRNDATHERGLAQPAPASSGQHDASFDAE